MHERYPRLAEQAQSKTPPQTHYGGTHSAGFSNGAAAVDAPLPEVLSVGPSVPAGGSALHFGTAMAWGEGQSGRLRRFNPSPH